MTDGLVLRPERQRQRNAAAPPAPSFEAGGKEHLMPEIFYVAVSLANDAFGHTPERAATADDMRPELVRLLKQLAKRVEDGGPIQRDGGYVILDVNGNTCGHAGVVDDSGKAPLYIWRGLSDLADGEMR